MQATTTTIHPFEAAGLGKAPFRFVGMTEERGPIKRVGADGAVLEIGAPGQPMGTCDYCGQGIALVCAIESADGKRFKVGSDCVLKVCRADNRDSRLIDPVKRAVNQHKSALARARREKKKDAERARIAAAREAFNPADFAGEPHPAIGDKTLADDIEFLFVRAGHNGQLRAAAMVEEKIAKYFSDYG